MASTEDQINVKGIRISLALLEPEPKKESSNVQYLAAGVALSIFGLILWAILGVTCVSTIIKAFNFKQTLCEIVGHEITKNKSCQCVEVPECWSFYPCVRLRAVYQLTGDINDQFEVQGLLYNTIYEVNSECSYSPRCSKDYRNNINEVDRFLEGLHGNSTVTCFYDTADHNDIILNNRSHYVDLLHALLWPLVFILLGLAMFYKFCASLHRKRKN